MKPLLLAVVHTEEEFDWSQPFDRSHDSVTHLRALGRAQELFARHGCHATYMLDYPVAAHDAGIAAVKSVVEGSPATIGAHLHPWVNPPFDETVSVRNSFPGNLPRELEKEKLKRLADRIAEGFGIRPKDYLAGRYGFGGNTLSILQELGFRSDLSVAALMDYRTEGGPDYSGEDNFCFFEGEPRILRIPHNAADVGFLCRKTRRLFEPGGFHLDGLLSRLGAITRVRLSPEGFDLAHLKACARALVAAGTGVLVFSFHSPSLVPGFTPYVRDNAELRAFLDRIDGFLRFFRSELGGVFGGPGDALATARPA
jgi:hypothetical protein